ncbi:protein arginine N-methyltransferase 9-like [Glandiceps talaboti]
MATNRHSSSIGVEDEQTEVKVALALQSLHSSSECLERKNYGKAFAHFLLVLKLVPEWRVDVRHNFCLALTEWTTTLERLGRIHDMLECYQQAYEVDPDNEIIHNEMGSVLFRLGFKDEAAVWFRKALTINPDFVLAKDNLNNVSSALVERWHFKMLNDKVRNQAYKVAIEKAVQNGFDTVLDIGTGTGILSMFAVKAGAKRVYGCEMSKTMFGVAKDVLVTNHMSDKIHLLNIKSTDIIVPTHLPERVSLVVTETMDAGLLGEGIMETMQHAWKHLLDNKVCCVGCRINTQVIPRSATVFAQIIESKELRQQHRVIQKKIGNLDLSKSEIISNCMATNLNDVSLTEDPYTSEVLNRLKGGYTALTEVFQVITLDFNHPQVMLSSTPNTPPKIYHLQTVKTGQLDAVVCWFTLQLDQHTHLSTSPQSQSCWEQAVYPIYMEQCHGSATVETGNKVTVKVTCQQNHLSFDVSRVDDVQQVGTGSMPCDKEGTDTVPFDKVRTDAMPCDKDRTGTVPSDKDRTDTVPSDKDSTDTVPSDKDSTDTVPSDKDGTDTVPFDKVRTDAMPCDTDRTGRVTSDKDRTDTVPSDKDSTDTVPCDKDRTGTVPSYKYRTDTVSSDKDMTDTVSSDKDMTNTMSSGKDRTDTVPCDKDMTDAMPSRKDRTDAVPCDKDRADVMPSDKDRTDTVPCDKDRADAMPSDKDRTDTVPCDKGRTDTLPCDKDMTNTTECANITPESNQVADSKKDITQHFTLSCEEISAINDSTYQTAMQNAISRCVAKRCKDKQEKSQCGTKEEETPSQNFVAMDISHNFSLGGMYAAQAGCSKVLYPNQSLDCQAILQCLCECNDIADDKIEYTDIETNDKVDLLIVDVVERTGSIKQQIVEDVAIARASYLHPNACIIPCGVSIHGICIESDTLLEESRVMNDDNTLGLHIAPFINMYKTSTHMDINLSTLPHHSLTPSFHIMDIDWTADLDLDSHPLDTKTCLTVPVSTTGTLHAVLIWYDLHMDEDTIISTLDDVTHWQQSAIILEDNVNVVKGDSVEMKVTLQKSCIDISIVS